MPSWCVPTAGGAGTRTDPQSKLMHACYPNTTEKRITHPVPPRTFLTDVIDCGRTTIMFSSVITPFGYWVRGCNHIHGVTVSGTAYATI